MSRNYYITQPGRLRRKDNTIYLEPEAAQRIPIPVEDIVYCLRFFRPLPKGRLCYNNNLIERSYPMAKRRKFTPEFKAEVVLEVLSGVTSQAELCRRRT